MITERTLKKWRKEAFREKKERTENLVYMRATPAGARIYEEMTERILRMTQELLDLHLMRKK